MSEVNVLEAIRYGMSLILYLLAITVVGVIIILVGAALVGAGGGGPFSDPNIGLLLIGLIISVVGYVVILAGNLGIGYKVIADGVSKGVDNSKLT